MPSRLPLPRSGDRLSYRRQRELVQHIQAARQIMGEGGLQTDWSRAGAWLTVPKAPAMMLAEIVDQSCGWKQEKRSSGGWPYQYHYTIGRPVLYYLTDGTWAAPVPRMDEDSSSSSSGILDEYIVHPTGYPRPLAETFRLQDVFWPLYSVGDWVWCIRDFESGLWAIHDGYESWLRVELAEDLQIGRACQAYLLQCTDCPPPDECPSSSSSSGVYEDRCGDPATEDECEETYSPNTSFSFCIYDALCGQEGIRGQRGYVKFFADSRRFELVSLARRVFWRFELAEDLDQWQTGPCKAYRRCWDRSGYGNYATDCNQQFHIADWSQIGYFGYANVGATGVCEMHKCDAGEAGYMPGWVGVITDLRCPPECVCGEDNPDPQCGQDTSGA